MLKKRLTFKEAMESPDFTLMSRHRLGPDGWSERSDSCRMAFEKSRYTANLRTMSRIIAI